MADASDSSLQEQQQAVPQNPAAAREVAPLEREVMLQVIFSMLGAKLFVQLAGVNRQWRDVYADMNESKETSAAYALANLSTYEHCRRSGRNAHNDSLKEQQLLGKFADLAVLDRCALALFHGSWASGLVARNLFHRDGFEELRSRSMPPDNTSDFMWIAASRGSLECLQYLCATSAGAELTASEFARPKLGRVVAQAGRVRILEWMLEQGLLMDHSGAPGSLSGAAAEGNRMNAVVWLHEHGFSACARTCAGAAGVGNLQMLLWARNSGAEWDVDNIVDHAVRGGSVEVLKYLRDSVGAWDAASLTHMLHTTGSDGHLAAAQWLCELGGQLPTRLWSVRHAHHWQDAYWGHLCTVRWAMDNGASWGTPTDTGTCKKLRRFMHADAWQWAHEHGCPCDCTD
jgi:hypothetical protein